MTMLVRKNKSVQFAGSASKAFLSAMVLTATILGCNDNNNPRKAIIHTYPDGEGFTMPSGNGIVISHTLKELTVKCENVSSYRFPKALSIKLEKEGHLRVNNVEVVGLDDAGFEARYKSATMRVFMSYGSLCRISADNMISVELYFEGKADGQLAQIYVRPISTDL